MAEKYAEGRAYLKANWYLLENGWKSDQSLGVTIPAQDESHGDGELVVPLVSPSDLKGVGGPLVDLLRTRRSRRRYNPELGLSSQELSFLCWAAAGIREWKATYTSRTYPSGGARNPFDLFVFVARAEGCEPGLYRYLPSEHVLVAVREGDDSSVLDEALLGQYWKAAVVFLWAAVPYRTEWCYGPASHKLIALDVGHACQNLYLACEAVGAGTCALGSYDQKKLDSYLALDGDERFALYAAPVGKK